MKYESKVLLYPFLQEHMWLLPIIGVLGIVLSPILVPVALISILYKEILQVIKEYYSEMILAIFMRYK